VVLADNIDPNSTAADEALARRGATVIDLGAWRAARRQPLLVSEPADQAQPETRELTILFADIRGFSSLSEALKDDPQRLGRVVNAVLGPLSEIVVAHGGTVDKFIGDSIMAYWGAPLADPDHAAHAVAAAQAMLAAMDGINADLAAAAGGAELPPIHIGIGVNSGACVVGKIGSERHFNYSVLGDAVNIASRLVGLSKTYGVHLLIGEATARLLPSCAAQRQVDRIAVRGRTERQAVFTPTHQPVLRQTG
jgi:adenylate cyclase